MNWKMPVILSLDDNEDILFFISILLNKAGLEHKHICVTSSHLALKILESRRVDLITMDLLRWDDMGGEEVYDWLKESVVFRHIPVLIISADLAFTSGTEDDFLKKLQEHGDDYLSKLNLDQIADKVQRLLIH
jgi:CheY-like chemotaxis protein